MGISIYYILNIVFGKEKDVPEVGVVSQKRYEYA